MFTRAKLSQISVHIKKWRYFYGFVLLFVIFFHKLIFAPSGHIIYSTNSDLTAQVVFWEEIKYKTWHGENFIGEPPERRLSEVIDYYSLIFIMAMLSILFLSICFEGLRVFILDVIYKKEDYMFSWFDKR